MPAITVAIPTFRRATELRRLLSALGALETERQISILVADNDAESRGGVGISREFVAAGYRWPLDYIVVPERGIAQVRNALVARAFADPSVRFIAMLDDDEWPERRWLEELLVAQDKSRADVVRGTILRVYEVAPPVWASEWDGVASIHKANVYRGIIDGTGNVLISRDCFAGLTEPYFDPQFGLTGGEDGDFFARLRKIGARFTWAEGAVVYEQVPAARVTLSWALLRAYRTGNSDMRIVLKNMDSPSELIYEIGKIIGALLSVPILIIMNCATPSRRLHGVRKFCRAAGKVGALIGHRYYEYADHGQR